MKSEELNRWIPRRAAIAHELRAEAQLDEPEAPAEAPETPDTPEGGGEEAVEERSWEERLEERIAAHGATEEGEDAETEPEEGEAAAPEEAEAEAGTEPTEEAEEGPEAEGEAEAEAESATDTDDDTTPILRLPARNEGHPDVEVELTEGILTELEAQGIDPKDFIERQNQLNNGYMRGNEVREAQEDVRAQQDELDYIAQELAERPADFLVEKVHPSVYPDVVRRMVLKLDDDGYNAVMDDLAKLDKDANQRKAARVELREKELDAQQERQRRTASSDYVKSVRKQIIGLVPLEMDDATANDFFDFALHKLEGWAKQNRTRPDPEQIPDLLEELGALHPYGLTKDEADARTDDVPTSKARPDGPDEELAERAKRTGKDLTERSKARKKAAATSPAGAGASADTGLRQQLKGLSSEEKFEKMAKIFSR